MTTTRTWLKKPSELNLKKKEICHQEHLVLFPPFLIEKFEILYVLYRVKPTAFSFPISFPALVILLLISNKPKTLRGRRRGGEDRREGKGQTRLTSPCNHFCSHHQTVKAGRRRGGGGRGREEEEGEEEGRDRLSPPLFSCFFLPSFSAISRRPL